MKLLFIFFDFKIFFLNFVVIIKLFKDEVFYKKKIDMSILGFFFVIEYVVFILDGSDFIILINLNFR